ncbi:MAG: hypothetical protein P8Y98_12960 [Anaerolineales bacterium]
MIIRGFRSPKAYIKRTPKTDPFPHTRRLPHIYPACGGIEK